MCCFVDIMVSCHSYKILTKSRQSSPIPFLKYFVANYSCRDAMISTKQHVYLRHRKADLSLVILTRAHDLLSRSHEIRTRAHEIHVVSRAHDLVSRGHELVSREHEGHVFHL